MARWLGTPLGTLVVDAHLVEVRVRVRVRVRMRVRVRVRVRLWMRTASW